MGSGSNFVSGRPRSRLDGSSGREGSGEGGPLLPVWADFWGGESWGAVSRLCCFPGCAPPRRGAGRNSTCGTPDRWEATKASRRTGSGCCALHEIFLGVRKGVNFLLTPHLLWDKV